MLDYKLGKNGVGDETEFYERKENKPKQEDG